MCRYQTASFLIVFLLIPGSTLFASTQQDQDVKQPPPQNPAQVVRPVETAKLPSTARKIFTNFWSDQKAMWTSPIHMNKDDAKWWGAFGAGTLGLIAIDKRISNGLPNT